MQADRDILPPVRHSQPGGLSGRKNAADICSCIQRSALSLRLPRQALAAPFTRDRFGALMPPGSEDLLAYVNRFLEDEEASGQLGKLAEEYIFGEGNGGN